MKRITVNLEVEHLPRVEGHGNIYIRVEQGEVREARWEVVETPRFFEVMLQGKPYDMAGILTARICGICSIGHCLASLRATENAFGIDVPAAAAKQRLLAKHGETLQSHALHLFFLAAPDLLGLDSAIALAAANPRLLEVALAIKGAGNRLCDATAGRTTHPVSLRVGGVAQRPCAPVLRELREGLLAILPLLDETVEVWSSLDVPTFGRETEYVALKGVGDYPWIGGDLISTDGVQHPERAYLEMTNEYVTPSNTSKWCKLSRESFAVGALARVNLNHGLLLAPAREAAERLSLRPVCHEPFANNAAQLVEMVHVAHESVSLIDDLLATPKDVPLAAEVVPRAAQGVGAVEVPRGILYHSHTYDADGRITRADCVIPTTQNNANIEADLHALAADRAAQGVTDAELERLCCMLVRAYDPCISCSVH